MRKTEQSNGIMKQSETESVDIVHTSVGANFSDLPVVFWANSWAPITATRSSESGSRTPIYSDRGVALLNGPMMAGRVVRATARIRVGLPNR